MAFHLGVLKGLHDKKIFLEDSDYVVGTSAGSQVSTTITSYSMEHPDVIDDVDKVIIFSTNLPIPCHMN
ncbi:hypothetical protein [Staphylococcus schleiferi]|uniref:hypothetical protein n=1 Tax=Staphylococcus schleiferi TaxID=1295 RepID=UPI001E6419C2|nr:MULTISPECIES: hypothetical protein [Staphylococcus]